MRSLILFLQERRDVVALVAAVTISTTLLSTQDNPELRSLRMKAHGVISTFYAPVEWVEGIWALRKENADLSSRVTQLRLLNQSLLALQSENESLREMLAYRETSPLLLTYAKVIHKGIGPTVTTVTIDQGTRAGLEVNDPVVSPEGLVGRIAEVGDHSSVVQILSDYNFRLSVRLETSGAVGVFRWSGGTGFEVWEIQKTTEVRIGDRVMTSGLSELYPGNLPVAEVIGVMDRPDLLHKIVRCRALADFSSLQHLFVVRRSR